MRVSSLFAVLVVVALPSVLWAQTPASVTVLLPERFQVDEEVATELLEALNEAVASHPDYTLNEIPPQTISELLLAVGCGTADPDCLAVIGEILESDYMIWGEVGGTERAYLVELTLWDFAANEAVYRFTKAIEADESAFAELLPVYARCIVYGPIGHVEIIIEPPEADVMFDSRETGAERPIVIDDLELGTHVIRASADGFFDYRDEIVVDIEPMTVDVEMVPTTEIVEVKGGRVWTWVAMGAGVTFTGLGVAFALLSNSTQDDFDTEAGRVNPDLDELQQLQDTGERQALLANVFFAAGAASFITGIILIFVEDTGPEVEPGNVDVSLAPRVSEDGAGISFGIGF